MKTNYLIYYVLKLITKGQEWQYNISYLQLVITQ